MTDKPEIELTDHELHVLSFINRGAVVTPTVRLNLDGFTAIDVESTILDKLHHLGLIKMKDECGDLQNVPSADSVRVKVCEHGSVHVLLVDSANAPIATAFFSLEGWCELGDDVADQAEAVIPGLKELRKDAQADPDATKH